MGKLFRAVVGIGVLAVSVGCQGKRPVEKAVAEPADFFPVTSWELEPRALKFGDPRNGLGGLKECGFTTAAFVLESEVAECRRLGMKAIVRRPPSNAKWVGMSDEQIEAR